MMILPNIKVAKRVSIVVSAQQPFIDWLNVLCEEDRFTMEKLQPSVYLMPERVTVAQAEGALEEIYLQLFESELLDWTNDELLIPKDKTYKLFREWFEVEFTMNVFEVVEMPKK